MPPAGSVGPRRLTSLEELETAVVAGASIYVKGKGTGTDAGPVVAASLDARLRSSALGRFDGKVVFVDGLLGTLLLEDGTVIRPFEATRWKRGGRWLSSTPAIIAAMAAGEIVRAAGKGTLAADGSYLAASLRAKVKPVEQDRDAEGAAEQR